MMIDLKCVKCSFKMPRFCVRGVVGECGTGLYAPAHPAATIVHKCGIREAQLYVETGPINHDLKALLFLAY